MTALGTLAAGIAHDFKYIYPSSRDPRKSSRITSITPVKSPCERKRIKMVVEQGSGIVNAMLGFSRPSDKQLSPADVNVVVEENN